MYTEVNLISFTGISAFLVNSLINKKKYELCYSAACIKIIYLLTMILYLNTTQLDYLVSDFLFVFLNLPNLQVDP